MRNYNILRYHSQHLTQMSKVKVTEPKTAKNVIFDGRYPTDTDTDTDSLLGTSI